jgi:hypothetical protein
MRHFNDKFFGERLQKASEARQAMLKRAEKLPADHPDVLQRVAERQAIAAAREARNEAKAQAAIEQRAREEAEQAERAAEAARKAREEADLAVAAQAEQKAARDARYAARKKRKA